MLCAKLSVPIYMETSKQETILFFTLSVVFVSTKSRTTSVNEVSLYQGCGEVNQPHLKRVVVPNLGV